MTNDLKFIHLRVHTEYSLLEGAVQVKTLPDLCAKHSMPAVAVTDTNNMFGALEFATTAGANGIQPIHGCQVDLVYDAESAASAPVVLLAQNREGYGNLLKLNSCIYLKRKEVSSLAMDDLANHRSGLICLTGGSEGPIGRLALDRRTDEAGAVLRKLGEIFDGGLYVEIQRHPSPGMPFAAIESEVESEMLSLAYRGGFPLVATNDVHFQSKEKFESHDALLCIADGAYVDQTANRRKLTPEHYFKSQDEMAELFGDLPEAVENTVEIARRCSYCAEKRSPILPRFADNESEELRNQARSGLEERLKVATLAADRQEYADRLNYELDVIEETGFAGYFLIVADFIKWAKRQGIPVGPGRGSGAGSLVAYALTITDLDPLSFNLLFERFLNPERVSMPDFDVDFCQERRDEVIRYVRSKYGAEKVAHIITFGGLLSRVAVRDMGRVMRMPYGEVDRLAKMIPRDGAKNLSIEQALMGEPRLQEAANSDPAIRRLFANAREIEGLLRNASTHAAGVVIGDRPLDELVPIYKDPKSEMPATQFSMYWVEQAGLVKFDLLGLKTLTVIKNAVDLIARRGVKIDINNIPLDDEKTFKIYSSASTVAVFQLESSGMKDTLRMMKPTCIEDIVALVALYRPGPIANIPQYCAVKNGKEQRKSQHPSIDHILAETHGIMVYQEQVMQIAQAMAGYSLGGADLLRRAIGKKKQAEMDAEQPKFLAGAERKGVNAKDAQEVWQLMAKFAEYGFNKAHAAAYAVVSYQTAWLKANHPVEFMASVMNCDSSDAEKLSNYSTELRRMGIELVPPCINRSETGFSVDGNKIFYGLGALKSVGREAANGAVAACKEKQFCDLFDLASRVELKQFGKRALEMLVCAGVFDSLDKNRKRVHESLDTLIGYSESVFAERQSEQLSLFGDAEVALPLPKLPIVDDWTEPERLEREFEALGFYLSGHPLDELGPQLKRARVETYLNLCERAEGRKAAARLAGSVSKVQMRVSEKNKTRYAFVELSDTSGVYEVMVFSEELEQSSGFLKVGARVLLDVETAAENGSTRLKVNRIRPLKLEEAKGPNGLKIYFNSDAAPASVRALMDREKKSGRGGERGFLVFCPIADDLPSETMIEVPGEYFIGRKIRQAIGSLEGIAHVDTV